MVDVLFRSSMNVSSHPLILPASHYRRASSKNRSATYFNASPIAVNNKIKAIKARKTPLALPIDTDYTDIHRLNFGTAGVTCSKTDFSVLSPERLFDRSKDTPLSSIPKRPAPRSSNLSTTLNNQPSSLWPISQASNGVQKRTYTNSNSTVVTPPIVRSAKNKSSLTGKMPDVIRHPVGESLIDRQNTLTLIEPKKRITLKKKPLQKPYVDEFPTQTKNLDIQPYETENDDENILFNEDGQENIERDEEFERYLEAAMLKCAEWLIKYVFTQMVDEANC